MARSEALGIKRIESVHFYVNDLERSRSYWVDQLDFAEIAASTPEAAAASGEKTVVVRAGDATYFLSTPVGDGRCSQYLARHPDGVSEIIFEVEDVQQTFTTLEGRGATLVNDVETVEEAGGRYASFSITTAFGDVLFTFVERDQYEAASPGVVMHDDPIGGGNKFGFGEIDHVTSNFLTLAPFVAWCKQILGLEEYWGIEFHTKDYSTVDGPGSGLKSVVLWDPHSGVKFANNEPLRPYFRNSQIYLFVEDNRGPGVQHTAVTIEDIVGTVNGMREAGMKFMPTPGTYYDALVSRLDEAGIEIDEAIDALRDTEILVDGEGPGKYLLQIFAQDFATAFDDRNGGPFFLEIIQRKGDRGFGGGNFRALFESIERAQLAEGRIAE